MTNSNELKASHRLRNLTVKPSDDKKTFRLDECEYVMVIPCVQNRRNNRITETGAHRLRVYAPSIMQIDDLSDHLYRSGVRGGERDTEAHGQGTALEHRVFFEFPDTPAKRAELEQAGFSGPAEKLLSTNGKPVYRC